jgi:hypothetical protein
MAGEFQRVPKSRKDLRAMVSGVRLGLKNVERQIATLGWNLSLN